MQGIEIFNYIPPSLQTEIGETTGEMIRASQIVSECLETGIPLPMALEEEKNPIVKQETVRLLVRYVYRGAQRAAVSKVDALHSYMGTRVNSMVEYLHETSASPEQRHFMMQSLRSERRILSNHLAGLPRTESMTIAVMSLSE